jgi:DNA-binding MarR family transcriptional regulator
VNDPYGGAHPVAERSDNIGHMTLLAIDQRIGNHLKRAEQELMAAKTAALRPFDLNVPQYTLLLVVAQEPGLSGAELARRCLVTPQTMSSVLRTLESRELVKREPHPVHSHVHEVRLTRKARELLNDADRAACEVELRLGAAFSEAESRLLLDLLGRCTATLTEITAEQRTRMRG